MFYFSLFRFIQKKKKIEEGHWSSKLLQGLLGQYWYLSKRQENRVRRLAKQLHFQPLASHKTLKAVKIEEGGSISFMNQSAKYILF